MNIKFFNNSALIRENTYYYNSEPYTLMRFSAIMGSPNFSACRYPFEVIPARRRSSPRTELMAVAICSGSFGSMYIQASPPVSGKTPPCVVIVGTPEFNASRIGIPNPS